MPPNNRSRVGAALALTVGLVALVVLLAPGGAKVTRAGTASGPVGVGPAHWTGPNCSAGPPRPHT